MNEETLEHFQQAIAHRDEMLGRLQTAIDNLINSSDLNARRYVITEIGSLELLQAARDEAWAEYLKAEEQLIRELNEGLFPGQHRSG